MAKLTDAQLSTVRSKLTRAESRFNGAAKAASRANIEEGEFDNNFDGVVTGIFHVVDAFELARTGIHRRVGEGEQATIIRSVLAAMQGAGISAPAASRLIDLNSRRNTSVHGHWVEILDRDALEDAVMAGRHLLRAAREYLRSNDLSV